MKRIRSKAERKEAVKLIKDAFKDFKSINWMLKSNKNKAMEALSKYCIKEAIEKEGAFITEDKNGVALVYSNAKNKFSYKSIISLLRLLINVVDWRKSVDVILHQIKLKKMRKKGRGLYFFMLAAKPRSIGDSSAKLLRDKIFAWADKRHLPIYAETTVRKNMVVYKRLGFQVYNILKSPDKGFDTWFVERLPLIR